MGVDDSCSGQGRTGVDPRTLLQMRIVRNKIRIFCAFPWMAKQSLELHRASTVFRDAYTSGI